MQVQNARASKPDCRFNCFPVVLKVNTALRFVTRDAEFLRILLQNALQAIEDDRFTLYFTTKLTIRPGTTIAFTICLPSSHSVSRS